MLRRSMLALIPLSLILAGCAPKKSPPGPGVSNKPPMPGQTGALTAGQAPGGTATAGSGGAGSLGNAPGGLTGK
ncbi:MAG: hypothetical protein NT029_03655 [Armatimonadetes bacterium]|nr:hypothetical protein [Armatimonadota bacterium]